MGHLLFKVLILQIFFIILVGVPTPGQAQCHSLPDLSIMDRDFYTYLKNEEPKASNKVAFLPFYDNEEGYREEALSYSIPFFLYDSFVDRTKSLVHPYLVLKEIKAANLNSATAQINSSKLKTLGNALESRFVVYGTFQRSFRGTILVTIYATDTKTGETLSPAEEFETNMDDSLFSQLVSRTSSALGRLKGAPKIDLKDLPFTPTLPVFKAYGKASRLAGSYNRTDLELATIWFEKALKESYHRYPDAALGLARANFMIALIKRLQKIDHADPSNEANKALTFAKKSKKNSLREKLAYRFQEEYAIAAQATAALMNQNTSLAVALAEKALKLVPEDGFMQGIFLSSGGQAKNLKITLNNPVCY